VNKKNKKTLEQIFKHPTPANIIWKDIESLFVGIGCDVSEGAGSRVRVKYKGVRAVFHRPHPQPDTDKGSVNSVKRFLKNIGVKP
jgi:hypothetical protein